jgi:outer membrane lipoprotein-sorting protein
MINKLRIFILLPLVGLLFVSCSQKETVKRSTVVPAERVIIKLEAKRRRIKTFTGIGTVYLRKGKRENKFNFEYKFKKPDSLYIAGIGPFGITVAEALFTDESFNYYDAVNNVVYRGNNSEKILAKLFGVPLSSGELRSLMMGFVNLSPELHKTPVKYSQYDSEYNLTFLDSSENIFRNYIIEKNEMRLINFSVTDSENSKIMNIHYYDFKSLNSGKYINPYEIKVEAKKDKTVLDIHYKRISVNSKLSSIKFIIPNDAKLVEW